MATRSSARRICSVLSTPACPNAPTPSSQRDDGREVSTLRRAVILYEFQFETGPVDAEAEFVLSREDGSGLVLKFAWVVIRDPVAGDVTYPAGLSAP